MQESPQGMNDRPPATSDVALPDDTLLTSGPQPLIDTSELSPRSVTPLRAAFKRLQRDKLALSSLYLLVFLVVLAMLGPVIYQHIGGTYISSFSGPIGPDQYHSFAHAEVDRIGEAPSAQYWLGTDGLGRDIFARLMQGILISLTVAILVEVVDVILGVSIGVLAGFYGGGIDQFLARFTDVMFAFPGLLFLILISGILGNWADKNLGKIPLIGPNGNARLLLVSLALAFTIWPLMARYVRGQALQLKQQQYVEAARTVGSSDLRIIMQHIVPNLSSIVVIAATLNISNTIIAEAGISYLGLGVQPPGSSIGLMISDSAQYIRTDAWMTLVPCVVLMLVVLAFSFLGDGVRDAFDPRTQG